MVGEAVKHVAKLCVCEAVKHEGGVCAKRGSLREEKPGRTDRVRRKPQESGETNESPRKRRTATHTNTFRKILQKRLLREAVGFLELLLEERIP